MAPRIRHKKRFNIGGTGPAGSPQAYDEDHEVTGAFSVTEINGLEERLIQTAELIPPMSSLPEAVEGIRADVPAAPDGVRAAIDISLPATAIQMHGAVVAAGQMFFRTSGYFSPGVGAALYRIVEEEPPHAAKIELAGGKWGELAETTVLPEMVGALGYEPGSDPVDDTLRLQGMLDYAMMYGCRIEFSGRSGTRHYGITSTLKLNAVFTPADLGYMDPETENTDNVLIPPSAHFSNHPSVDLRFVGNATLVALAPIDVMVWLGYDYSVPDSLQPYWSRLSGFKFDGNNLSRAGIRAKWAYRLVLEHFCIFGVSVGVELDHVGVSDISDYLIYAKDTCIDGTLCGDLQIHDGECWPVLTGIKCGVNVRIYSNTFTSQKLGVVPTPVSTAISLNNDQADQTWGVRDIDIFANEFCNFDYGVYAKDLSTEAQKDIYSIRIACNHVVRTNNKPNARLGYFEGVRGLSFTDNHAGDRDWEGRRTSGVDLQLVNCVGGSIKGGVFAHSTVTAIHLSGCKGISVGGVTFDNIVRGGSVDGDGMIELVNSTDCSVIGCSALIKDKDGNDVAGSEHIIVERGTSDRNVLALNQYPTSWVTPIVVVGKSTTFGNSDIVRLPLTKAELLALPGYTHPSGARRVITGGTFRQVFYDRAANVWRYCADETQVT